MTSGAENPEPGTLFTGIRQVSARVFLPISHWILQFLVVITAVLLKS